MASQSTPLAELVSGLDALPAPMESGPERAYDRTRVEAFSSEDGLLTSRVEWLAMSEALTIHGPSRMAEAPGSRTQPSRDQREATDFEDREGHRAPFASIG